MKHFLHILECVVDATWDQVNSAPRFLRLEDCRKSHFNSIQNADLRQDAEGRNHHARRGGVTCSFANGTHFGHQHRDSLNLLPFFGR